MNRRMDTWKARGAALLLAGGVFALSACEGGILEVEDRGIIVPEDIDRAGPAAIPTLLNGVVGAYQEATDDLVRYAAMLSDEMILSGTFPTRLQVDNRRIFANNASLTDEMYVPLHQARLLADTTAFIFQSRLTDPAFAGSLDELREGIAYARLYGGFTRLWLAQLYCWSILTGMANETQAVLPDARVQEALGFLREAEQRATQEGLASVQLAAILGQARAQLWLRNYPAAAQLARQVPRSFVYLSEYSNNNGVQYNEVFTFTHGVNEAIRWTVGDGSTASRGRERFEHYTLFTQLNLIRPRPPGFTAFSTSIPVHLQMRYARPEAGIFMASGVEARLIEAEAAVRAGSTAAAEVILNDLRADFSARTLAQAGVTPPDPANALQPIVLSGNLQTDVKRVADERARELWLTGDRMVTSRRLRRDPEVSIDLFPPQKGTGWNDSAFPIVQRELDNNPNLTGSDACPTGAPGSWS